MNSGKRLQLPEFIGQIRTKDFTADRQFPFRWHAPSSAVKSAVKLSDSVSYAKESAA